VKRAAIALSLVLLAASGSALAQSSIVSQLAGEKVATENLYFSLKCGMNIAYLDGTVGTERTGGFDIGLSATFKLTERLSLVPEITPFSRKGVASIPLSSTGDGDLDPFFGEGTESALALKYIDIPVILKYRLGRFHVGAGPFVSFLGSATEKFRADLETGDELRFKRDVTERYRKMDYGLAVEASWTITKPRRGMGLIFHVRYQAGLADILRDPAAAGAVRNSVVQVYVSFPFVL
jgi:hypothetical protein